MERWTCRDVLLVLFVALAAGLIPGSLAANPFGAFGPEGARMREQLWIVPGADPEYPQRATLFRPELSLTAKMPLVIINHGTDDDTRLSVSMPVYYWLSRWFVERGFAVLLPQRRGHGATGGPLAESFGSCEQPDHYRSGNAAADDISAALEFMKKQPFIDADDTIAVGVSTGGWASLALAARYPDSVGAIVNFAGGRGGHAYGKPGRVCGEAALADAASAYGAASRVPTVWFYAANDSFFPPRVSKSLATAWASAGGKIELNMVLPYGVEGHNIASDHAGWQLWGDALDRFLSNLRSDEELSKHNIGVVDKQVSNRIASQSPDQTATTSGLP